MCDNETDYTDPENTEIENQVRQLARRLKEEREKVRISQMELSLMAGLSQNQVFCIETGKRVPNLYTILKLCSALCISPTVLFSQNTFEKQRAKDTIMSLVSKYM
ncbi:MAG: hypothetical protein Ta2G_01230 [Termitinemataceae bacterium]|nr:MAG: hypothetical protein Ta2G_01230 [Termitinemataceae bacterium]